MILLGLENIGQSLVSSGIIHSPLFHHLVMHEMMHSFFSVVRKRRSRVIGRSQIRRIANRKRRRFVDNIIMHHRRLHDRNRQIIIASARSRVLSKDSGVKNSIDLESRKWRDRVDVKDRGAIIRGRVDARRVRARSRWISVKDL